MTLNIESIYTDTSKIKEQLINALKEECVPERLCENIKNRVDIELNKSATLNNSDDGPAHLKINIYNIIILIIQEVIKCRCNLKESF